MQPSSTAPSTTVAQEPFTGTDSVSVASSKPRLTVIRGGASQKYPGAAVPRTSSGMLEITFAIPASSGPALRSAIDSFSSYLANKAEGMYPHHEERTLTEGIAAVGRIRAAVNRAIPHPSRTWPRNV